MATIDFTPIAPLDAAARQAFLVPRLRIVHHADLARIGAVTADVSLFMSGEWQTVGRSAPLFVARGREHALDDPTISREQLRVRWNKERHAFEVASCPGAKRAVHVLRPEVTVDLRLGEEVVVLPDACVVIGERAVLALEAVKPRSAGADRMGLVGESDVMWALRDEIADVAAFDRPALVTGPTGAGKELVAGAIHAAGPHARGPFIALNCAALAENLVESTLFGHKKGAFTGADRAAAGCFVSANGGTLFLDEIGELPLSIQPKLLRVLQDRKVTPVGGTESRQVDCRVVAATNRDLRLEVAAGRMREDLYQRVAAHVVQVPPLDARRFDVPELFVGFLERVAEKHPDVRWLFEIGERWRPTIPQEFFLQMIRRRWPGNVRELENYVEQVARVNRKPGAFTAPPRPGAGESDGKSRPPPAPPASGPDVAEIAAVLGLAQRTVVKLFDEAHREQAKQALDAGPRESRMD